MLKIDHPSHMIFCLKWTKESPLSGYASQVGPPCISWCCMFYLNLININVFFEGVRIRIRRKGGDCPETVLRSDWLSEHMATFLLLLKICENKNIGVFFSIQGGPTWDAYPLRGDSLVHFRQKIIWEGWGIYFQHLLRYRVFKKVIFEKGVVAKITVYLS